MSGVLMPREPFGYAQGRLADEVSTKRIQEAR
jgi:hypothetical protein